jgi:hypothetical protein
MAGVKSCPMPPDALLSRYQKNGFHTDCYFMDIPVSVSQQKYVIAFYSTALFRLERFILKWTVSRPSTAAQLARMASGEGSEFAAWSVEDRSENQLLLSDFQGRTRSWLMTSRVEAEAGDYTRLYFGSAVVSSRKSQTGERRLGLVFKALLGFHKLYSVALLWSAAKRLMGK